jgi:hypothetical protein
MVSAATGDSFPRRSAMRARDQTTPSDGDRAIIRPEAAMTSLSPWRTAEGHYHLILSVPSTTMRI